MSRDQLFIDLEFW